MDWLRWEHDWYDKSADQLTDHVSLALDVHDFIESVATLDQIINAELSESRKLERNLMRRLGEEYRAVDLLATNGHGFQAMSSCANVFELAHTLGYIVKNDAAAEQWFASTNRKSVPWKVRALVVWNGKNLGWDETRCDEEYARYGFVCGFKHHNPLFTRVLNLPFDADLYCAQFALAEGANLGLVGVSLVALFRLEGEQCSRTLTVATGLLDRAAALLPRINQILLPTS
jgi:hypothetical protein